jgi:Flp pilus assembly protein CpaB
MRGGRILVIVGLILVAGAVLVAVLLWRGRQQPEPSPVLVEEGVPVAETPPPEDMKQVVVAALDIPRGTRITAENNAVKVATLPQTALPEGALTDLEAAYGRIARVDVVKDTPITRGMLVEAVLQIPAGKVAYAMPVARYSSVAWAIQPGDHVDVLISVLVVELDEEFQTALPNNSTCVQPTAEEGCQGGLIGRLEVLPNAWVVNLTPNEEQRPRLVTQLTVQDAIVLRVGDWPGEEDLPAPEEELVEEEGAPQPTPAPRAAIEPVTLIVTPQDAMVLKYAEEVGASIDLVLRSAEDTGEITTEAVTLQYLFDRFAIELPPKLPYGVTPPLKSLQSGATGGGGAGAGESVVE